MRGISHIDNARRNREIILQLIRDNEEISRRELSTLSSLSIATAKRIVEALISEGIISETGTRKSKRGRRSGLLHLNPDFAYSVGLTLYQNSIQVTGISLTGEPIFERRVKNSNRDREGLLDIFRYELDTAVREIEKNNAGSFLGIGIGMPGLIDIKGERVLFCPGFQEWEDFNLSAALKKFYPVPVVVDDSVHCMSLVERRYGEVNGPGNFLYIYLGDAVGTGIFIDGKLYRGKHGISGELGHFIIKEDGLPCRCGNTGCLEALVSQDAILRQVNQSITINVHSSLAKISEKKGEITLEDIHREAMAGDKLSQVVINNVSEYIGSGLANMINIFDPGLVILGGELVTAFQELLYDGIMRTTKLKAMNTIFSRTDIQRSNFRSEAASRGAAEMVIEDYLNTGVLNISI